MLTPRKASRAGQGVNGLRSELCSLDQTAMKKDLLTILDLSAEEIEALFQRASLLKEQFRKGTIKTTLAGKTLGLLFDKPSTRTRVSFEAAMYQLGGQVIFMSSKETQLSRDESLRDTAQVLSRYIDGIVVRTYEDVGLQELAKYAESNAIDMIVMGIRGHGLVKTLFLGSTTDRVVRRSPCPVLSVGTMVSGE